MESPFTGLNDTIALYKKAIEKIEAQNHGEFGEVADIGIAAIIDKLKEDLKNCW